MQSLNEIRGQLAQRCDRPSVYEMPSADLTLDDNGQSCMISRHLFINEVVWETLAPRLRELTSSF
jgi:hypothetical protein